MAQVESIKQAIKFCIAKYKLRLKELLRQDYLHFFLSDDLASKQARWKALVRQAEEAAKLSPGRRKTKPCRCADCGLTCPNKTALKMHRQQHHGNRDDLSCPDCPFRAACHSRLEEHLSVHRGEKPLSCDLCQYRTAYSNNLHKHRQVVHPPRKDQISCHLCSYSTHVRSYLRKHLKTHAGIKRDPPTGRVELTCDLCPYKTRVKECLKHHLKTHSGERPFPCEYCDYRAAIQKSLTTHLKRKHGVEVVPKRVLPKQPDRRSKKGEEEFVCEDCPMRFNRSHALVRHRRKHTGERPYTCDYCYRSFALKNALTRHILAHMGVKNYACDQCNKRYSENKSLRKHKMTVHPAEGLVAS